LRHSYVHAPHATGPVVPFPYPSPTLPVLSHPSRVPSGRAGERHVCWSIQQGDTPESLGKPPAVVAVKERGTKPRE
jgi:hypothetical protein